jgi:hypothetical protein
MRCIKERRKAIKKGGIAVKITHVMKDGSKRESINGVVIQSEEFYRVLASILDKKKVGE